ncbi:GNAT family N-acetyltransferase [Streptomyces sp. NBC_01142]|uniref:GNAT family N-acetyltransferase n=1 Tax=Streptomyces sp. NBC_01142 TaxID=2975865 RepID=UPI002258767C|nr:GNAT family N-acetyltransferase [Streptomyces sp. NBC_01142]MCX4821329.1 GNAT family N-acetyltransferase [Streptomyces sp. NBC_01142]
MERPKQIIDCGDFALRRWQAESDFDPLFRMIEESLDHLRPWMPWVARHSPERIRNFLARCDPKWQSGDAYNYAITANGTLAGSCSMYRVGDPQGRGAGYWLHPAATGQGIATRATAVLAAEAFALPNVEYLEIAHDLANTSSGAVPRRLGFSEVRREQVTTPPAPSDSGIDVVWRLNRPTSPLHDTLGP